MREIRLAKWRFYLLGFITLWSFGIAADFMVAQYAAGRETWTTLLHNAAFAAGVTLFSYFMHRDEK
jgi:ABC-type Mn2+/Zn2+ transport system permease subunit